MILRELVTRLGFDADNASVDKHESALKRARNAALALTAAYAATVGAVTAFTARIAGVGDEVAKTSRLIGVGTDDLQAWRYSAGQAGVATSTLDSSLRSFTRRLGAAAEGGGPAAETLERLGISVRNADGSVRNISDVLPEAADAIAGLGSEAEKANAAQNLFNASGRQMVLWLDQGSEGMALAEERFHAMGGAMSGEGTANAEALGDALDDINVIVRSLSFRIGEQLMPMVTETALAIRDWYIQNRELITQNIARFFDVLTMALRTFYGILRIGFTAIDTVVEKFGGWERVLRIVTAAIVGFIALKLGGVLWAVAAAITGAGAAARLLRIAMLALTRVPIIALMVAIGLAIEDLIVWINGGDSAIGRWLGSWDEFSAKAKAVIDEVIAYIQPLIDAFMSIREIILGALTLDIGRIIQGFNDLGDSLIIWALQAGGDIANLLLDALTPDIPAIMQGMRELGRQMLDWAKGIARSIADSMLSALPAPLRNAITGGGSVDVDADAPLPPSGTSRPADALMLPTANPAQDVQRGGSGGRNVSVNARIESTLQVPAGTSQEQSAALRREAESTFEELFSREINRTLNDYPVVD